MTEEKSLKHFDSKLAEKIQSQTSKTGILSKSVKRACVYIIFLSNSNGTKIGNGHTIFPLIFSLYVGKINCAVTSQPSQCIIQMVDIHNSWGLSLNFCEYLNDHKSEL